MDNPADIATVEVTSTDDRGEERVAKMVCEILVEEYPVHLWNVGWQGGAIVVKHLATDQRYGMVLPRSFSYSDLRRNVMLGAGELLERAGLRRGAWDGELSEGFDKS